MSDPQQTHALVAEHSHDCTQYLPPAHFNNVTVAVNE
jgi:hypothetical protein